MQVDSTLKIKAKLLIGPPKLVRKNGTFGAHLLCAESAEAHNKELVSNILDFFKSQSDRTNDESK